MSATVLPTASHATPRNERSPAGATKAYRGVAMEGVIARWYARTRGTASQRQDWRRQAEELVVGLPPQADVLEVAPGPGYFAVEIARTGRARVTAVDISRTFVEIVGENARAAGVSVAVRQGDAAHLPFEDASFDLVVSQAAFKNFAQPQQAVDEFYRVLRPGGCARIQDMSHDAPDAAIREEVAGMGLGRFRAFLTRRTLHALRRRAYTSRQFEQFARTSPFQGCEVRTSGIGLEVRLVKPRGSSTTSSNDSLSAH